MNERNEKLSAFIDDALHSDELMSFSLSAEADDAKIIQRYQMVGDTLRGELSESSFIDVSAAVREALAEENIADQIAAGQYSPPDTTPAAQAGTGLLSGMFGSWLRPVGGLAVAATVAVVMVSTLSQPESDVDGTNPFTSPVADNGTTGNGSLPGADLADQAIVKATDVPTDVLPSAVQGVRSLPVSSRTSSPAGLNPYINQHLDHAPRNAVQGRLPYARSAIYGNQQNTPVAGSKPAIQSEEVLDTQLETQTLP